MRQRKSYLRFCPVSLASGCKVPGTPLICQKRMQRMIYTAFLLALLIPAAYPQTTSGAVPDQSSQAAKDPKAISEIRQEAVTYQKNFWTYKKLFWILTILAGASAVGTAIKSGIPKDQSKLTADATSIQRVDWWIMSLSILSLVATASLAAINPKDEADRYRFGEITMERALAHYDGILGIKSQADVNAVLTAYDQAELVERDGLPSLASGNRVPVETNLAPAAPQELKSAEKQ
jgi:hypothetical protein